MSKKQLEHVRAAEAEALRLGASFTFIVLRSNIEGTVTVNGRSARIYMAKTPSDWRVPAKVRRDVRHTVLRLTGAASLKSLESKVRG
jgi:hypothetical protein